MLRRRIIPVLLLSGNGLVKTTRFRRPSYVGDPINVVRIFNEKEVDEIVLFDVEASRQGRAPRLGLLADIASEAFMPVCYGGGVRSAEDARALLSVGIEKIALGTAALRDSGVVREISGRFGAQCVVGVIDVRRDLFGRPRVFSHAGVRVPEPDPVRWAEALERAGAGELLVQAVDRDGTLSGLDRDLARRIGDRVGVPVVLAGGARDADDMAEILRATRISGVGVGGRFVWYGPHRAVLVTYLSRRELAAIDRAVG